MPTIIGAREVERALQRGTAAACMSLAAKCAGRAADLRAVWPALADSWQRDADRLRGRVADATIAALAQRAAL